MPIAITESLSVVALVGERHDVRVGQGVEDAVGAGCGQVVRGAGQRCRCPDESSGGIGDYLDVDAVRLCLPE